MSGKALTCVLGKELSRALVALFRVSDFAAFAVSVIFMLLFIYGICSLE